MTNPSDSNSPRQQLFDQVTRDFLAIKTAGQEPDRQALLARYPDLAAELSQLFEDDDWMRQIAAQDPERATSPLPLPLPSIGGFEIVREIGQGGMSVVYEAREIVSTNVVALKMLLPYKATQADAVRFCKEFEVMASLKQHMGIVPVYRCKQDEATKLIYYTMKLLRGSLTQRLSEYTRDPRLAAGLVVRVAGAVEFAHSKGVLHRDLKPSNILSDEAGQPYVGDFGLAKMKLQGGIELTRTGGVVGSTPYMSPEQAQGKSQTELTEATDVYGLGAVLYTMLTGQSPFHGNDDETLRRVREEKPERPSSLNPAVPLPLEAICLRCLEKAPANRYDSAKRLIEDLENFLLGRPIKSDLNSTVELTEMVIAGMKLCVREPHTLRPFRVGSVEVPVTRLVGGDGEARYTYPDGIICAPRATKFALPPEVEEIKEKWLAAKQESARRRNAVFENRPMVRLDDYRPGLSLVHDRPWPLHLSVSLTEFFHAQLTNGSIDDLLPGAVSLRTAYAGAPDDLLNSRLANPLCTNLSLVTSDGFIYVAQRSTKVATSPGGWAPAVSGTGNPILDVITPSLADYSPFQQALRESYEEAAAPYSPELSEITFFGLARTLQYYYPFLFGELRIKLTSRELESQLPGDNWETRGLVAIPFTVQAVTDWIALEYGKLLRREIPGGGVYTAIFSLLQSLAYEYPKDWQEVIQRLTFESPSSVSQ